MQGSRPIPGRAPSHPRTKESGFTLIELLIASFLLTVGILGVSQVFAVANRHVANSKKETMATCLAQEIQEKMMSETFADLASIFDGVDTSQPETVSDPASLWAAHVNDRLGYGGVGVIDVTTPAEDESVPYGMVSVTVTMKWYEGNDLIEMPLRFSVAKIGS